MADITLVNLNDPGLPDEDGRPVGSRWVFEKMLYQAPGMFINGFDSRRVVHLFALVSEEHQILKVDKPLPETLLQSYSCNHSVW